ncbi:MAG TPA: CAP domain-containing protein [Luteolibacter sp.]
MKYVKIPAAVASLCCAVLASCAPEASLSPTKIPVSTSASRTSGSLSTRILQEVNAYRATTGARPLGRNPGLDRLAQQHCEFLRKNRGTFKVHGSNVSHEGFESRTLMARRYYNISQLGENVAAVGGGANNAPGKMVQLWAASPSHNFAMKGKNWTETGIGVVVDSDGMVFATQLFGVAGMPQTSFRDGFNMSSF